MNETLQAYFEEGLEKIKPVSKPLLDMIASGTQALEMAMAGDGATTLNLRRTVQADGYSCGAQAAYMILSYYGKARSIGAVAAAVGTTRDGTSWTRIARLSRARGLTVCVRRSARLGDIEAAIDAGCPVLVCLHNSGHWAVVYGYSAKAIYVADPDPSCVRAARPRKAFARDWDRWAMIVSRRKRDRGAPGGVNV